MKIQEPKSSFCQTDYEHRITVLSGEGRWKVNLVNTYNLYLFYNEDQREGFIILKDGWTVPAKGYFTMTAEAFYRGGSYDGWYKPNWLVGSKKYSIAMQYYWSWGEYTKGTTFAQNTLYPVSKGDILYVYTPATTHMYFYPCKT